MITEKMLVRLLRRPIRGVPVGGELLLSRVHARTLILVGLAVQVDAPKMARQSVRRPRAKK